MTGEQAVRGNGMALPEQIMTFFRHAAMVTAAEIVPKADQREVRARFVI